MIARAGAGERLEGAARMSDPTPDIGQQRLYPATISIARRQPADRKSTSIVASGFASLPEKTGMSVSTRVQTAAQAIVWDDLDAVEQSLLAVAAREHTLDRACASWAQRARGRSEISMTKHSARRLLDRGLIGFFRVGEGYPDLTDDELCAVFQVNSYWDHSHLHAHGVGLYLTTAGEDVVLGS